MEPQVHFGCTDPQPSCGKFVSLPAEAEVLSAKLDAIHELVLETRADVKDLRSSAFKAERRITRLETLGAAWGSLLSVLASVAGALGLGVLPRIH